MLDVVELIEVPGDVELVDSLGNVTFFKDAELSAVVKYDVELTEEVELSVFVEFAKTVELSFSFVFAEVVEFSSVVELAELIEL